LDLVALLVAVVDWLGAGFAARSARLSDEEAAGALFGATGVEADWASAGSDDTTAMAAAAQIAPSTPDAAPVLRMDTSDSRISNPHNYLVRESTRTHRSRQRKTPPSWRIGAA
jgi:hypothetical protein